MAGGKWLLIKVCNTVTIAIMLMYFSCGGKYVASYSHLLWKSISSLEAVSDNGSATKEISTIYSSYSYAWDL